MGWKQFLKPDWRKVILFLIVLFLFPLVFIYICAFTSPLINLIIKFNAEDAEGCCFFIDTIIFSPFSYVMLFFDPKTLNAGLYYLLQFLDILWWIPSRYLPACFIVWIYDKRKKKS